QDQQPHPIANGRRQLPSPLSELSPPDAADFWRCQGLTPPWQAEDKEGRQNTEPQDQRRGQGYYTSQRRNGTEDEIIIHAPDGRHRAYIRSWEKGWEGPGAGDKPAKADARRILGALNAYQPARPAPDAAAAQPSRPGKAYHAHQGKDSTPFGDCEAIDIR